MKGRTTLQAALLLVLLAALALAGWSPQESGVTGILYDIECVGEEQVWAVGAGGTILHATDGGLTWATQTSGTSNDLYGVDFVDSLLGWATGSGPTIVRTTDGGVSWSAQAAGISDDLMDIAFGSDQRGWATGVNGAIIGTTNGGSSWSREISGIWGWYWGVTAASATSAWTIGGDWFQHVSPIYHYNGSNWSHQYDITRNQNGQDISVTEDSIIWAVADSGTISHSTNGGSNWVSQNSGTILVLNGVDAVSASHCWIVGGDGMILATRDAGTTWTPDSSGVTSDLYGIAMLDSTEGWACGAGGRILHRTGQVAVRNQSPVVLPGLVGSLVGDQLRVELPFNGPVAVRLFDGSGRQVRGWSAPARSGITLPLAGVPAGAYFVSVSQAGRHSAARFVKLH